MSGPFGKILNIIRLSNHVDQPLDKLQLDAAQDRVQQRATELDDATDELTRMLKRLKRRPSNSKGRR